MKQSYTVTQNGFKLLFYIFPNFSQAQHFSVKNIGNLDTIFQYFFVHVQFSPTVCALGLGQVLAFCPLFFVS